MPADKCLIDALKAAGFARLADFCGRAGALPGVPAPAMRVGDGGDGNSRFIQWTAEDGRHFAAKEDARVPGLFWVAWAKGRTLGRGEDAAGALQALGRLFGEARRAG
jgi:hypothetical protein